MLYSDSLVVMEMENSLEGNHLLYRLCDVNELWSLNDKDHLILKYKYIFGA